MKIKLIIISLFLTLSTSYSQEKDMSIYFHPLSFGLLKGQLIKLTFEKSLNDGEASIIGGPTIGYATIDWIGFNLGYRNYLDNGFSGTYLQPNLGFYKLSGEDPFGGKASVTVFDIIAYVGYKGRWENISMYIDGGLGYGFGSVTGEIKDNEFNTSGFAYDVNFGFGINL